MQVAGLHKGSLGFQLAYVSLKRGRVVIERLESKERLFPCDKERAIVTGVEGSDVLIRHFYSPLKTKRALQKTLPFQLDALIPYPPDDGIIRAIYVRWKSGTRGVLFAISQTYFLKYLNDYRSEGIDPEWVSVIPMALCRFGQFVCPQAHSFVVFHLGQTHAQLVSVRDNMVHSHCTIDIGSQDFLRAFDQDNCFQVIDADEGTAPHLQELLERFRREVDRALCFFAHNGEAKGADTLLLFCGEMAGQMEGALSGRGMAQFSSLKVGKYGLWDAETLCKFSISIGLCLDALKGDCRSLQFRQGKYISHSRVQKIKKELIKGGVIATFLLVLTLFYSYLVFEKKERYLSGELENFVKQHKEMLPSLMGVKEVKGLSERVRFVDQKLGFVKTSDGYFSPPPLVSDLLAFLSSHPNLKDVELLQIDYELQSCPDLDHPQDRYMPKVRLFLSSEDEGEVREVRDAIAQWCVCVDVDAGVEWNAKDGGYEIAFFLHG